MSRIDTAGTNTMTAVPQRVFLSHTSDLGKDTEPGSFVAAAVRAVLRARHAVTDMAYFAAREASPAATCVEMVAQSDVYLGIVGLRSWAKSWWHVVVPVTGTTTCSVSRSYSVIRSVLRARGPDWAVPVVDDHIAVVLAATGTCSTGCASWLRG